MKIKNVVVGTKVRVKRSHPMKGAVGVIVDVGGDDYPLVQFDVEYSGLTDTRRGFKNSRYMDISAIKRVKE